MATISLRNGAGQVIASIPDDTPIIDTGQEQNVGGEDSHLVQTAPENPANPETPAVTGYVPESQLNELNVRTVTIPQNFAGMEAIMVPTRLRPQLFDIVEVVENEDYVEVTALHMFYRQSKNYTLWKPTEGINYTGAAACRNVLTNQLSPTKFLVASDCTDERPGDEMDYERRNIVETFLDPESGICAKYDLSMIRDNDVFYCLKDVGYDRGFLIENGKNLLGVERHVNIENLVTRVAPVGRDAEGEYVWLDRNGKKYVDSTHINDYPWPRAEIYYTDLTIGENGVTAENIQQKLYEEALTRFSIDEADIPEVTMTIQFVSLGDTEEYKQYRNLDKAYLYDILTIKDTIRGYNYAAQVVGVEHNILTGQLESVTIGHLTETDGTRKVATWKVPEINGHKVRHKTIRTGSYEPGSIRSDDISDGAVNASHMSQSADGHFKAIFAEELYISNTSEDGLLNVRFTVNEEGIQGLVEKTGIEGLPAGDTIYGRLSVEAGKVAMVVGTRDGQNYIKAAEIATSINDAGEGVATINADKVYIGNEKSTTVIAGKCSLSDVSADYISGKIATIPTLTGIAASFSGNVSAAGGVSGAAFYVGGTRNISNPVMSVVVTGPTNNVYKLTSTKADGTYSDFNFSRAITSWISGWSNGVFTATANPQNQNSTTTISQGAASWSGKTVTIPVYASVDGGTDYWTGRNVTATYPGTTIDDLVDFGTMELYAYNQVTGQYYSQGNNHWYAL